MYRSIFTIFAIVLAVLIDLRVATFALLLADKSSDLAVLGSIGILLLVVLANAFIARLLFARKSKQENKNAQ